MKQLQRCHCHLQMRQFYVRICQMTLKEEKLVMETYVEHYFCRKEAGDSQVIVMSLSMGMPQLSRIDGGACVYNTKPSSRPSTLSSVS